MKDLDKGFGKESYREHMRVRVMSESLPPCHRSILTWIIRSVEWPFAFGVHGKLTLE